MKHNIDHLIHTSLSEKHIVEKDKQMIAANKMSQGVIAMIKTLVEFMLSKLFQPEGTTINESQLEYQQARKFEYLRDTQARCPFTTAYLHQDKFLQTNQRNAMWNYLSAALKGHKEAQYKLGISYLNGSLGMDRNYRYAEQWLTKAKQQGHPQAGLALSKAYSQIIF